jgi:hypothetical protein
VTERRPVTRPAPGVAVDEVHPANVGELRYHRLGQCRQLLLRLVHCAHGARRPGEDGEPLAGADLVVDVGVGAHPLDDHPGDAHRHRAGAEPAVAALGAQPVGVGDDLRAVRYRPAPGAAHVVAVHRVDRVEEPPPAVVLDALPGDRPRAGGRGRHCRQARGSTRRRWSPRPALVADQGALALGGERVDLAAGARRRRDVDDHEADTDDGVVRERTG